MDEKHSPLASATVTIVGSASLSPDLGFVDFFDANGPLICHAGVGPSDFVECTGYAWSMTNPMPVTVGYAGTIFGADDGLGSVYSRSSGVFQ